MLKMENVLRGIRQAQQLGVFKEAKQGVRKTLLDSVKEEVDALGVDPTGEVVESLYVRENLPDKLFPNGRDMNPDALVALRRIVEDFWSGIGAVPEGVGPKDAVVVGSAVSYNWSQFSDIDVHLVVDFSEVDENFELVADYFNYARSRWNDNHAPKVAGLDVEVYIEDVSEENITPAKYSVLRGDWVKEPEKTGMPDPDVDAVVKKAASVMNRIEAVEAVLESGASEEALEKAGQVIEYIKKMRKAGLEKEGIFSVENLVFKVLRRNGSLGRLFEIRGEAKDLYMSL